jgi:hypothetical protein
VGPGGSDTASVDDTGKVTASADCIYSSNGTK